MLLWWDCLLSRVVDITGYTRGNDDKLLPVARLRHSSSQVSDPLPAPCVIVMMQEWIAATVPFFYFVPLIFQVSWLHNMAARFEDVRDTSIIRIRIAGSAL